MIRVLKTHAERFPRVLSTYRALRQWYRQRRQRVVQPALPALAVLKQARTHAFLTDLDAFLFGDQRLILATVEQPRVTVILVTFNRAELTFACLRSLLAAHATGLEILIVDNASTDRSADLFARLDGVRVIPNDTNRHFLRAANQGAGLARGEVLLFLNNDAQVLPGAIEAALEVIDGGATVGAVGGPLILADDRLQEAGSIVWRDGTCLGYGRGEDPRAGPYRFRRRVDYCSGAFLMTPRRVFAALGGFDEAYCPAYYEEVDYCLRLRQHGLHVWYEPRAAVRHFEFASAKGDAAALDMQRERQRIFLARQAAALARQFPCASGNILRARALPHDQPRLLFIDERLPDPGTGAGYPRANQMIQAAHRLGWFVTVYPAIEVDDRDTWSRIHGYLPPEIEVLAFPPHGPLALEALMQERAGYYQAILISRPSTMARLRPLVQHQPRLFAGTRLIYDAEAIIALRAQRQAQLRGTPWTLKTATTALERELGLARGLDRILTVSAHEADCFRAHGFGDVQVVSHAVAAQPTDPGFAARQDVLFLGAIQDDDSPNADALFWFIDAVLPRLREQGFTDTLLLAGPHRSARLARGIPAGVRHLGFVEDPRPWYARTRFFIAPTRFAAGIPLKVIEAAAAGLPVIATPLVGEQLGWRHERELLLAEDAEGFAAQCLRLGREPELWARLRDAALNRVREDYSHDRLEQAMRQALGE